MKKSINISSQDTIARGYRLKPSTHRMISRVQKALNLTQDKVISLAIKLYSKEKIFNKK